MTRTRAHDGLDLESVWVREFWDLTQQSLDPINGREGGRSLGSGQPGEPLNLAR
ncbi:MAG: hypothetical protein AB7L66_12360 [Gemmatimonadales bacterium]